MFNNIAFDIVIGLVFIYLLYSLFATVISELITTWIGLRARNMKEGIDRMLNDEDQQKHSLPYRIIDSLKLLKNPDNLRVRNFYNHPEIKYLGSTGVFKVPSSFKAVSFSKTIIYLLSGEGAADKNRIEDKLKKLFAQDETLAAEEDIFDKETAKYVLSLWHDSYGDVVKFKLQLEAWFDRTMEQATEWYKRKIHIVLLVLGFCMAWFFNADTFTIISKLSTDKSAREQMVTMATAYIANKNSTSSGAPGSEAQVVEVSSKNTPAVIATVKDSTVVTVLIKDSLSIKKEGADSLAEKKVPITLNTRLDSLMDVKRQLEADINNANSLLGSGAWLPDSVMVTTDKIKNKKIYTPQLDETVLLKMRDGIAPDDGYLIFETSDKWCYFFGLFFPHFFGFLVTAIAISLGAPFWFDLLNKMMKLRTSTKQETGNSVVQTGNTVSPLNREG